jgi:hypothetical protein
MTSSAPRCFDNEESWKTWLALAYQSGEWNRMANYPEERVVALEHMREIIIKRRDALSELRLDEGPLSFQLTNVDRALTAARKQEGGKARVRLNYCIDCTKEHKTKMMEQGRCARPSTRFVVNYSPLTNEATVEGDPLVHIGRYAPDSDSRSEAARAGERASFSHRAEVAL